MLFYLFTGIIERLFFYACIILFINLFCTCVFLIIRRTGNFLKLFLFIVMYAWIHRQQYCRCCFGCSLFGVAKADRLVYMVGFGAGFKPDAFPDTTLLFNLGLGQTQRVNSSVAGSASSPGIEPGPRQWERGILPPDHQEVRQQYCRYLI